jgi:hypothetical protein
MIPSSAEERNLRRDLKSETLGRVCTGVVGELGTAPGTKILLDNFI